MSGTRCQGTTILDFRVWLSDFLPPLAFDIWLSSSVIVLHSGPVAEVLDVVVHVFSRLGGKELQQQPNAIAH